MERKENLWIGSSSGTHNFEKGFQKFDTLKIYQC